MPSMQSECVSNACDRALAMRKVHERTPRVATTAGEEVIPFRPITFVVLAVLEVSLVFAFQFDACLPLNLGVLTMTVISAWALYSVRVTHLSPLCRLYILIYAMPFSATLGYLFSSTFKWGVTAAALSYESPAVCEPMLLMGIIGELGLILGMCLGPAFGTPKRFAGRQRERTLSIAPYFIALLLSIGFSWLSAPATTIMSQSYASEGSESAASAINFNSSVLFSYLIITLLFIDQERDLPGTGKRRWKSIALMSTVGFITIFLQLLRGDRDVTGLLAGLAILYLTGARGLDSVKAVVRAYSQRIRTIAMPAAVAFIALVALGSARFELQGGQSQSSLMEMFESGLRDNTWTYVLITNLGIAADHAEDTMQYVNGETYIDYLRSLPPGIVTAYLGIQRPLESTSGPNWWYEFLSLGGLHPVCVPFKNFGVWGLVFVLGSYGFFIARCELQNCSGTMLARTIYGAVATVAFLWFWYGDMNVIRAVMISLLLLSSYRVFC